MKSMTPPQLPAVFCDIAIPERVSVNNAPSGGQPSERITMTRTLAGNLTGKAAHGRDDIGESVRNGDIFDDLTASLRFALDQRRAQFTWTVKKDMACLACRSAFKWHKTAHSIVDQIKSLSSIVEDARIEAEQKENAEILAWIPPVTEYADDLYNWARGG
jgi:hypothetical protein